MKLFFCGEFIFQCIFYNNWSHQKWLLIRVCLLCIQRILFGDSIIIRDEWIPLFSDIRILGYLGYRFSLDTWISGYLDIMDIWIHGYLDTWISVFFGYMDTWILWISFFFIIQILDILSKYPDIFGYFF